MNKLLICGPSQTEAPTYQWELFSSFNTLNKKWITVTQSYEYTNVSDELAADASKYSVSLEPGSCTKTMLVDKNYQIDVTQDPPIACPYDGRGPHNFSYDFFEFHILDDNSYVDSEKITLPHVVVDCTGITNSTAAYIDNAFEDAGGWRILRDEVDSRYQIAIGSDSYAASLPHSPAIAICENGSKNAIMLLDNKIGAEGSLGDSDYVNHEDGNKDFGIPDYPEVFYGYIQPDKRYDVYRLVGSSALEVISSDLQRVVARPQYQMTCDSDTRTWSYISDSSWFYVSRNFDFYDDVNSNYNEGDTVPADYENPIDHAITFIDAVGNSVKPKQFVADFKKPSSGWSTSIVLGREYIMYFVNDASCIKDGGANRRWTTLTRVDTNQTAIFNCEMAMDELHPDNWNNQEDYYFAYADQPLLFTINDHHQDVELDIQHFIEILNSPTSRDGYYVTI